MLENIDWSKVPAAHFKTAVDPNKFPNRFRLDDPSGPHTLDDTLGFVIEMFKITPPEGLDEYIHGFAENSQHLRDMDRAAPDIRSPFLGGKLSAPETIARLARYLPLGPKGSYREREDFLVQHLLPSETLRANLERHDYAAYDPAMTGAVWPLRDAANALGGMAAQCYPQRINDFVGALADAQPAQTDKLTRIMYDYRYVAPRPIGVALTAE